MCGGMCDCENWERKSGKEAGGQRDTPACVRVSPKQINLQSAGSSYVGEHK